MYSVVNSFLKTSFFLNSCDVCCCVFCLGFFFVFFNNTVTQKNPFVFWFFLSEWDKLHENPKKKNKLCAVSFNLLRFCLLFSMYCVSFHFVLIFSAFVGWSFFSALCILARGCILWVQNSGCLSDRFTCCKDNQNKKQLRKGSVGAVSTGFLGWRKESLFLKSHLVLPKKKFLYSSFSEAVYHGIAHVC